ncbi:unnamed protein product [Miscanthus lutarioriparius]|uniref:Uncharacterized protein n=1 Tax=Miscanthus lutarioriparius TaxID=422564 RepID=A0A811QRK3_9POAL|nr:unnamed protein product [Miscanthus lutarioriparius]
MPLHVPARALAAFCGTFPPRCRLKRHADGRERLHGAEVQGTENVAFAPQGRMPYTGVADGRVVFWDGKRWVPFATASPRWTQELVQARRRPCRWSGGEEAPCRLRRQRGRRRRGAAKQASTPAALASTSQTPTPRSPPRCLASDVLAGRDDRAAVVSSAVERRGGRRGVAGRGVGGGVRVGGGHGRACVRQ